MKCADFSTLFFIYMCAKINCSIPSSAIIAEAFGRIKPAVIIAVPLVIEKLIRKKVFPKIQNNRMRMLLHMPVISKKVKEKTRG